MSAENPSEMVFKRSLGNKEPKENRGRWHRSNCIDGSGSCWKFLWREIIFVCSYAEKLALILTGEENRTDRQQQETQSQVRKTEKNGCFESFTSRWWQSETTGTFLLLLLIRWNVKEIRALCVCVCVEECRVSVRRVSTRACVSADTRRKLCLASD